MGFEDMAPWDANSWFDLPVFSTVTVSNTVAQTVATSNPMRVGLILSTNTTGSLFIGPGPPPSPPTQGLTLATNAPILLLSHHEWGVLVQSEWWAISSGPGVQCSVVEIRLRAWPRSQGMWNGAKTLSRPKNRIRWPDGYPVSWKQPKSGWNPDIWPER